LVVIFVENNKKTRKMLFQVLYLKFSGAKNIKECKNVTDASVANVGRSDEPLDAVDDALVGAGVQDAERDRIGQADGAVSTNAL
jgi:hypothetical protein